MSGFPQALHECPSLRGRRALRECPFQTCDRSTLKKPLQKTFWLPMVVLVVLALAEPWAVARVGPEAWVGPEVWAGPEAWAGLAAA